VISSWNSSEKSEGKEIFLQLLRQCRPLLLFIVLKLSFILSVIASGDKMEYNRLFLFSSHSYIYNYCLKSFYNLWQHNNEHNDIANDNSVHRHSNFLAVPLPSVDLFKNKYLSSIYPNYRIVDNVKQEPCKTTFNPKPGGYINLHCRAARDVYDSPGDQ
jgi:hypothetical protein